MLRPPRRRTKACRREGRKAAEVIVLCFPGILLFVIHTRLP